MAGRKKKLFWQLWQCHCRKCKKKKIVLAIVAMPLPKMEKKKKIVLAIVAMALPKM